MTKEKTKFVSSDSFRKRYKQHLKTCLINKDFQKAIKEIRQNINIPIKGFKISSNGFQIKKEKASFISWLTQLNKTGRGDPLDLENIYKVIGKHKKLISTDPNFLLQWLVSLGDNINDYFKLWYNEESFVLRPPIIEIYQNYVNEVPFIGVFEYILFNQTIIPKSNLLAIKERDFFGMNYIMLAISPNTTKRDVIELWPEISKYQRSMKGYNKNAVRYKKNFKQDLQIVKYDKKTEKLIKDGALEDQKSIKSKRLYDSIDELANIDPAKDDLDDDKKRLSNRRVRKSRIKKKLNI